MLKTKTKEVLDTDYYKLGSYVRITSETYEETTKTTGIITKINDDWLEIISVNEKCEYRLTFDVTDIDDIEILA
jgi:hypothetical protein